MLGDQTYESLAHELAEELRRVAETFAEVPDGRHTAHTLGLLATGSTTLTRTNGGPDAIAASKAYFAVATR